MKQPLSWQASQWQQLGQRRAAGRLPHAILLQGPPQGGKRHFAEAFAQGLLCQAPLADGTACGTCPACLLMQSGNHPDLMLLAPEAEATAADEGKKTARKTEKPSQLIRVEVVRDFIEHEALSSHYGGYKLAIIDPAEAMNASAANALLKTLEEPRPSTLILLVSSQPERLLPTIRSRCQVLSFPLPTREQGLAWLQGQAQIQTGKETDWPLQLALAGGAPFKALRLADPERLKAREALLKDALTLLQGQHDPIALADAWSKQDMEQGLEWLGNLLLDAMRLQAAPDYNDLFNPDLRPQLQALAQQISAPAWHRMQSELIKTRQALNQQLNLQLQLEALLTFLATKGS